MDDEFRLQTVTIFKKVKEEYIHKCRENKSAGLVFTSDTTADSQIHRPRFRV
jgi:V-type H+-transporting ATPase subunit C